MISKQDCILLLTNLQDNGIDVDEQLNNLIKSKDLPISVIKFINDHRQLDLTNFYNKLRKSYNHKKSQLYGNIVKEIDKPTDVLTTLASLNLQILLFSRDVKDSQMFLKHARAKEISMVLTKYFTDYDLTSCLKLLRIIKIDLKTLEELSKSDRNINIGLS